MQTLQFLSVMSSANSAGSLVLGLTSFDLQSNVALTLSVSGLTGTETENQLAFKCYTQINTYLTQLGYIYPNTPPLGTDTVIQPYISFPDQTLYPSFAPTFSEHVVCLSSQCSFTLSVNTNTTGARIDVYDVPTLVTLKEARDMNQWLGLDFYNDDGTAYTDSQLAQLLHMSSAALVRFIGNNIIPTTYMYGEVTQGTRSVFTNKGPIIDFFPPVARRPSFLFTIAMGFIFGTYKSNFAIDKERKEIYYRYAQDFLFNLEPFDDGNEIMIPYIAGYKKIPSIIKEYTLNFINLLGIDEYKMMQGQSFRVETHDRIEIFKQYAQVLGMFFCD